MCSNGICLTVDSHDRRIGQKFINIPQLGYPKLYFYKGNEKIVIPKVNTKTSTKIIIQFNLESELVIEYCEGWESFLLECHCIDNKKNEKPTHQFARLDLQIGGCNTLHLKAITYLANNMQCKIN